MAYYVMEEAKNNYDLGFEAGFCAGKMLAEQEMEAKDDYFKIQASCGIVIFAYSGLVSAIIYAIFVSFWSILPFLLVGPLGVYLILTPKKVLEKVGNRLFK